MKIAHEAPISIFNAIQRVTDYDYALVHLFESNPVYWRQFKDAVINGREVILDNSIFELGTAFDSKKYVYWIHELLPTWYIIPDVLEDYEGTIRNLNEWQAQYDIPGSKSIAVVQGKTVKEVVDCYKEIVSRVDKVAISFDYCFFNESPGQNKYERYMHGRMALLQYMVGNGVIHEDKPHHLLGCGLPQEFKLYRNMGWDWIDSIDTSNPIVHGLNDIMYTEKGLDNKISTKLIEYIDSDVSVEQLSTIMHNVKMFRSFCK